MKKNILFMCLAFITAIQTYGYDAKVGSIYYNFNTKNNTATVTYMSNSTSGNANAYSGSVVIPDEVTYDGTAYKVTKIEDGAFNGCSGMTSLTIPKYLEYVEMLSLTFNKCTGMSSISVTSGNNNFTVYNGCLYAYSASEGGAYKLVYVPAKKTSISFPSSVKIIGNSAAAFSNITSVTIPSTVTEIESEAFYKCLSLSSVTIPLSVTKMGSDIFGFNSNTYAPWYSTLLSSTSDNSVIYVGQIAYSFKGSPTSIAIKSGTLGIADNAFNDCTSATSVTMPNTVKNIGQQAFDNCKNITSVQLSTKIDSIDRYTFENCSKLTSMTIPDKCKKIKDFAFFNCTALQTVTLGTGIKSIDYCVFDGCSNIKDVYVYAEGAPNAAYSRNDFSAFDEKNYTNAKLHIPYVSYKTQQYAYVAPWSCFSNISYIEDTYKNEMYLQFVDLGLPSGTWWATSNLGAVCEEDYGDYYAWGETTPKTNFTQKNYVFGTYPYSKYNSDDAIKALMLEDDAAYQHSGGSITMPTKTQVQELIDQCTWTWTDMNGIAGYKVSKNGKSIFLPAAGYKDYSSAQKDKIDSNKIFGNYLSKTLEGENSSSFSNSISLYFDTKYSVAPSAERIARGDGGVIRPVKSCKNVSLCTNWRSDIYQEDSREDTYQIEFDVCTGDKLYFDCGVSSEEDYDYLYVFLDGSCIVQMSGYKSIENEEITGLKAGHHILRVTYQKDESNSEGSDCGWISNVRLFNVLSKGDINGDSNISMSDITTIISIMNKTKSDTNGNADVNGDGVVNKADVDTVIKSCILKGK